MVTGSIEVSTEVGFRFFKCRKCLFDRSLEFGFFTCDRALWLRDCELLMGGLLVICTDSMMEDQINSYMTNGHASFEVNLLVSDQCTAAILILVLE